MLDTRSCSTTGLSLLLQSIFPLALTCKKSEVFFFFFYILLFNEVGFPDKRFVFSPASLLFIPPSF